MAVMDGRMLDDRDAEVLVGVLASLEGPIQAEVIQGRAVDHFRRRLRSDGYLAEDSDPAENDIDVRQKLNDLNQRLRFVLGEQDDPSASYPL